MPLTRKVQGVRQCGGVVAENGNALALEAIAPQDEADQAGQHFPETLELWQTCDDVEVSCSESCPAHDE